MAITATVRGAAPMFATQAMPCHATPGCVCVPISQIAGWGYIEAGQLSQYLRWAPDGAPPARNACLAHGCRLFTVSSWCFD